MEQARKKFYVCTAIAYPNGRPHMGHALEIIQADALARFYKLKGESVHFQTGTDEHGKKNWQTAEKEGKTVHDFLNENVAVFKDLYKELNISYDYFIRTSEKNHYTGSQSLWKKLHESGDIYKETYKGLYCVGCEAYKTDKDLENGICPDHPTRSVETIEEENYFFRLSKYAQPIAEKIESDEFKITPNAQKKQILRFLAEARDISFSRPASVLPWGVPVPDDKDHVMYVWCDALANYITGPGYGQPGREQEFNSVWPCNIQVVGRDILKFHAAYYPAMLLSAGLPLPKEVLVHGFLKVDGLKMGKSTGNAIDPFIQARKYGVDQFRFYILGSMPLDSDGEYSVANIEERINNELVANFSNLCFRSLSIVSKRYNGRLDKLNGSDPIIAQLNAKFEEAIRIYETREFRQAVLEIMEISALGNKYMQDKAPWSGGADAQQTLCLIANLVKNLSILLTPIMPALCEKIHKQLNITGPFTFKDLGWNLQDHEIGTPEILVNRIEVSTEKPSVEQAKAAKKEARKPNVKSDPPSAMDVSRLDIRVGKIVSIKKHETADTLYIEEIDVGEEKPRQVVSGLVKYYSIEQMENREVVVLCNLKAANLKGIKSEAMVLCANNETEVQLLTPPKGSKPGDRVTFEGYEPNPDAVLNPKHKVWETVQPDLKTNDEAVATYKGVPFKTSAGTCTVPTIKNGGIK